MIFSSIQVSFQINTLLVSENHTFPLQKISETRDLDAIFRLSRKTGLDLPIYGDHFRHPKINTHK